MKLNDLPATSYSTADSGKKPTWGHPNLGLLSGWAFYPWGMYVSGYEIIIKCLRKVGFYKEGFAKAGVD